LRDTAFERVLRRFTFVPTMTRLSDSRASWTGETGRIDAGMILRHTRRSATHENAIYYVAGPPAMRAGLHGIVSSLGIDDDDIRTEDFAGY
jgi:Na+-transporting NADH:ubiquinone oxidoreductase subunit NqrF